MCSKYRDQYGAKAIGLRGATYQGQVLVLGGKSAAYDAVGNEVGFGIWRSFAMLENDTHDILGFCL